MAYAPVKMKEAWNSTAPFFVELYVLELRTGVTYIAACDEDIEYDGGPGLGIPWPKLCLLRLMGTLMGLCSPRRGRRRSITTDTVGGRRELSWMHGR